MVLTLGILSLMVCAVLGPFAWSMGRQDLAKMDAREMDDRERSLVQGGMVCGIVATIILGFVAAFFLIWLLMVVGGLVFTLNAPW